MKKSSIFLLICLLTLFCEAQQKECLLIRDTLCLVTLDIRKIGKDPIQMNGATRKNFLHNLKNENTDSLLRSFYRNSYYVPDLTSGVNKMIIYCMKDSSGYEYLKAHALVLAQLTGSIKGNSRDKKLKLVSGETVFVSVTIIGGSFWKVNKAHLGFSKTSNEEDISTIEQINECYVPFEIDYFKKPKSIK